MKSFHYIVNSDGMSFHGGATRTVVEDCFIVGNDNLIVMDGGSNGRLGPSHNVVRHCTFIKSSYAGNWAFPQGDGPIGPGNIISNCDVIRANGEVGLVRLWYGKPTTIDNLIFENIRVQSLAGYAPNPAKTHENRFLSLEAPDGSFRRSMTFKNIFLPSAQTSTIAAGDWSITFDHVYVAGKVAKCDGDLQLTKGQGVVTHYLYGDDKAKR